MKGKVAVISSYPRLTKIIKEIKGQFDLDIIVKENTLEAAVDLAHLLENDVDVFISRGATGVMVRSAVKKPTVLVDMAAYDVLRAVYKASKFSRNIGFIGSYEMKMRYNIAHIEEMLNVQIKGYYYSNTKELKEVILKIKEDGLSVAVATGIITINMLENNNLKGIMVHSHKDAVIQALVNTQNIIETRRHDEEEKKRLQTILHSANEGVIALGPEGEVKVFNHAAEKYTDIKAKEIIGEPLRRYRNYPYIKDFFNGDAVVSGEVKQVNKKYFLVSRAPIIAHGNNVGTVVTFQDVTRIQSLEHRIRKELFRKGFLASFTFDDIVSVSEKMNKKKEEAKNYAMCDLEVLITGESGTGKELFTQSIHNMSSRKDGPFVVVNCAALPESLLESELFGYEEGAFTGARRGGKAGLFEMAHKGTIFLDEIGEMAPQLQARLLRVLQEKEVMRIGGGQVIPVDCRIFAATNHKLDESIVKGDFRQDLYYRLNVLDLRIPALRERKEDIVPLAEYFIEKFAPALGRRKIKIDSAAQMVLQEYHWPGNVRELENFIKKALVLNSDGVVDVNLACSLINEKGRYKQKDAQNDLMEKDRVILSIRSFKDMEKEMLKKVCEKIGGNKNEVAAKLGISRTTLWKKLKEDH